LSKLKAHLIQGSEALGFHLSSEQCQLFQKLIDGLLLANQQFNLTAIKDPIEVIDLHLLDSFTLKPWIDQMQSGQIILDVGSGAGFPGLPLAVMYPQLQWRLIDARKKKVDYLQHTIQTLKLNNVQAIHSRLEHYPDPFDLMVCRAVSSCSQMIKWSQTHRPSKILMMKGQYPHDELAELSCQACVTEVQIPSCNVKRHIVELELR
tara:strand:+ start:2011 stop:2628 length:618 start_codon:yes stop_codon:yes gene_type:complete